MINQRFSKVVVLIIVVLIVVAMSLGTVVSFLAPATPVDQSTTSQQSSQGQP